MRKTRVSFIREGASKKSFFLLYNISEQRHSPPKFFNRSAQISIDPFLVRVKVTLFWFLHNISFDFREFALLGLAYSLGGGGGKHE